MCRSGVWAMIARTTLPAQTRRVRTSPTWFSKTSAPPASNRLTRPDASRSRSSIPGRANWFAPKAATAKARTAPKSAPPFSSVPNSAPSVARSRARGTRSRRRRLRLANCLRLQLRGPRHRVQQTRSHPVLKARMNDDLHTADDLKKTDKANLFVIFGEPDIDIEAAAGPYDERDWLRDSSTLGSRGLWGPGCSTSSNADSVITRAPSVVLCQWGTPLARGWGSPSALALRRIGVAGRGEPYRRRLHIIVAV